MKIEAIDYEPFHMVHHKTSGFNPKGNGPRTRDLPFYKVYVDELPEGIEAIVATSDLQGRETGGQNRLLGERISEELETLVSQGDIPSIGAVLLAGDLYDYPDCHKLGGSGDVAPVWNAFSDAFPCVLGVHGNHDVITDENALQGDKGHATVALDGSRHDVNGLMVAGVSGIIGKPTKNQRKTPEAFYTLLDKVLDDSPDVLLLHHGPDNISPRQRGDSNVRERFEKSNREGLVIFGHCHWDAEQMWVKQGLLDVLNVDGRVMVLMKKK